MNLASSITLCLLNTWYMPRAVLDRGEILRSHPEKGQPGLGDDRRESAFWTLQLGVSFSPVSRASSWGKNLTALFQLNFAFLPKRVTITLSCQICLRG